MKKDCRTSETGSLDNVHQRQLKGAMEIRTTLYNQRKLLMGDNHLLFVKLYFKKQIIIMNYDLSLRLFINSFGKIFSNSFSF